MKNEIRKRKKRFWAFCLAIMLVFVQSVPVRVDAAEYSITGDDNNVADFTYLYPGDTISYYHGGSSYTTTINYYESDGTTPITSMTDKNETANRETCTYTVKEYDGTAPSDAFKQWEKLSVVGYSSGVVTINLKAVLYQESNIKYYVDGAEVANTPNTYYEGKGVASLTPVSKNGYNFVS